MITTSPTSVLQSTRESLERGIADGLHLGAQLYASWPGDDPSPEARERVELVLGDRQPGVPMSRDTLMIWLSSTKPVAAVALGQLWERQLFDLDDPIARYIPEFGARGKDRISVRHILTHTGGFRLLDFGWPKAGWDEIIHNICAARPEPNWVPGEQAGYHQSSSWFILGELVRRLDGRHFRDYVREEIFEPLGMSDSWVGMPRERYAAYGGRIGKMFGTERSSADGAEQPLLRSWHQEPHVVGCSPGGNGYGPIRELGAFYEMLLDRGRCGDARILRPQTVEALTAIHRVGMIDRTFQQKLDWGLGFIVNSGHYGADLVPYGYGRHASRRTFGHSGFQSSAAFVDPIHGLVVAVAVNGNPGEPTHTRRCREIIEAIYVDLEIAAPAAGYQPSAVEAVK